MPSFDVVSEVDFQEVRNAVDQAVREYLTRERQYVEEEQQHLARHAPFRKHSED